MIDCSIDEELLEFFEHSKPDGWLLMRLLAGLQQEGLTVADNATPGSGAAVVAGRKLQIRRKACSMDFRRANLVTSSDSSSALSEMDSPQIKASRDVRCLLFFVAPAGCVPLVRG